MSNSCSLAALRQAAGFISPRVIRTRSPSEVCMVENLVKGRQDLLSPNDEIELGSSCSN